MTIHLGHTYGCSFSFVEQPPQWKRGWWLVGETNENEQPPAPTKSSTIHYVGSKVPLDGDFLLFSGLGTVAPPFTIWCVCSPPTSDNWSHLPCGHGQGVCPGRTVKKTKQEKSEAQPKWKIWRKKKLRKSEFSSVWFNSRAAPFTTQKKRKSGKEALKMRKEPHPKGDKHFHT